MLPAQQMLTKLETAEADIIHVIHEFSAEVQQVG